MEGARPIGPSEAQQPWRLAATLVLIAACSLIWVVAGPIGVRAREYALPAEASWDDVWWILDARLWFSTGTVDVTKALVLQVPTWRFVACWAIHGLLVVAGRRLGAGHGLVGLALVPALLGQLFVVLAYAGGW